VRVRRTRHLGLFDKLQQGAAEQIGIGLRGQQICPHWPLEFEISEGPIALNPSLEALISLVNG
jgi:hypothetical protein